MAFLDFCQCVYYLQTKNENLIYVRVHEGWSNEGNLKERTCPRPCSWIALANICSPFPVSIKRSIVCNILEIIMAYIVSSEQMNNGRTIVPLHLHECLWLFMRNSGGILEKFWNEKNQETENSGWEDLLFLLRKTKSSDKLRELVIFLFSFSRKEKRIWL